MRRVHYNKGDEIIEVTIRDQTGARIEIRRCNLADEEECGNIIRWLKDKYGFRAKINKDWLALDTEFFKF